MAVAKAKVRMCDADLCFPFSGVIPFVNYLQLYLMSGDLVKAEAVLKSVEDVSRLALAIWTCARLLTFSSVIPETKLTLPVSF